MKKRLLLLSLSIILMMALFNCSLIDNSDQGISSVQDAGKDVVGFYLSDLVSGSRGITSTRGTPYVTVTESPTGKYHVAVNLRPDGMIPFSKVKFVITTTSPRSGFLVNIGDSPTNDGWGGDASTTTNDSELQVAGKTLTIYAGDKFTPPAQVLTNLDITSWWDSTANQNITFTIENKKATYQVGSGTAVTITNNALFALNGQPNIDAEDDYIVHAAFNRTVRYVSDRVGSGVSDVYIELSNPVPANAYYGSVHNHTNYSDGLRTKEQVFTEAKSAGFDFFGVADHAWQLDSTEWSALKNYANNVVNEDNVFVAFAGMEWDDNASELSGHIAVINCAGVCTATTYAGFITWLKASANSVAFWNHPGAYLSDASQVYGDGADFYSYVTDKIVGIELWNRDQGFSFYYYGNPPTINMGSYVAGKGKYFFHKANTGSTSFNGYHIGAAGSNDYHAKSGEPALANNPYRLAILSTAKTKADLLTSLANRRFYSTLDKDLYLWFEGNGAPMGGFAGGAGAVSFVVRTYDASAETIAEVRLYRNGTDITPSSWLSLNKTYVYLEYSYTASRFDYYYVKVKETDGDEAISSPIYVC